MTVHDERAMSEFDLPDAGIGSAAMTFVSEVATPVVYNHCVRSYLFARELAAGTGLRPGRDYDDELLLLTCVLHDLGITDHANGDQRFEVDGADAAATWLRDHDLEEGRVESVWTAIALHTSIGLAHRFGTLAAVAQAGIGVDVVGVGRQGLSTEFADRVHAAWPRHDLGYAIAELIAAQVHANPVKGAPMTFPGLLHELVHRNGAPTTWYDMVDAGGWGDRQR
jgi:hypothetical protein